MYLRNVLAAIGGALAMAAGPVWAAEPVVFTLADKAPLGRLFVGEFAPGTMERGPIETQTPAVRLPLSAVQIGIDTGGDTDCGAGIETAAALVKANARTGEASADQCLFLAELAITSDKGQLKAIGQCDDWRNDVSYCWVEGDIGQFWLRRQAGNDKSMQLLLGPPEDAAAPVTAAAGSTPSPAPIPRRGVMFDSVFDDAGRAVSDRWLLLPPDVVTLGLTR